MNDCFCFLLSDHAEIRVFADAVSLSGPEVQSDAEESPTEVSAGDEDERIPLQCAWYEGRDSFPELGKSFHHRKTVTFTLPSIVALLSLQVMRPQNGHVMGLLV